MYNELCNNLLDILKQCKNDGRGVRLLFSNLKPSNSGMSRTCKVHVITKDGELLNLTFIIANLLSYTFTKDGTMRIKGCGTDMLFNTCYRINNLLYYYENPRGNYNHDISYHGYVSTSYDLI